MRLLAGGALLDPPRNHDNAWQCCRDFEHRDALIVIQSLFQAFLMMDLGQRRSHKFPASPSTDI